MPSYRKTLGIKVSRRLAEKARKTLSDCIPKDLKPVRLEDYIVFPLIRRPSKEELASLGLNEECLVCSCFELRKHKPSSLSDAVRGKIDDRLLPLIPRSFDIVGDIAVLELKEEVIPYAKRIACALMDVHTSIKTVLLKKGPTLGDYRLREYEVIGGIDRTLTYHKENGCRYKVDVARTFFSPRLSGERLRVAKSVMHEEVIVDMFAGVGPFSILIAKLNPAVKVYAVELNPDAFKLLLENIAINKVEKRVYPINSDVRIAFKKEHFADRLIMNLPFSSFDYLDVAINLGKKDCTVNFYAVGSGERAVEEVRERLDEHAQKLKIKYEIVYEKLLKEVSPRRYVVSLDFIIKSLQV